MTGIVQTLIGGFGAVAAAVTDAYFNLVTLLLPGNGTNGAQNNTFLDSSTNNFTITRNGNTTQGTFSPFSQTGWSNYFDGSGSYLTASYNSAFDVAGGTFTIEGWFFITGDFATNASSVKQATVAAFGTSASTGWALYIDQTNNTIGFSALGTGANTMTCSSTLTKGVWYHIAVVRNGTSNAIYLNGVSQTLTTNTYTGASATTGGLNIGAERKFGGYNNDYLGYISNFRVVKGTAVYTAAFTPPTSALTAITNTSLLTCQSNRFVDNSSNAFAITVNGTPSVQAFSPFAPTAAYDATTVGGSGYFDGTGDYVSAAGNAAFSFTGDFTIDGWIYQTAQSTQYYGLFSIGAYTNGVMIRVESSGGVWYLNPFVNSTTPTFPTAALKINLNTWYHVAVVRSGTTVTTYLNGTSAATMTVSGTVNSSNGGVNLGVNDLTQYWAGYVSGFRIIKGSAVVPSGVPTAPPTAITNTSLLTNFTNAGITDATAKNVLETVGNAQISTTQSKFGGSSMYFDGTGDWTVSPGSPQTDITGDVTIEFWGYWNALSVTAQTICGWSPVSNDGKTFLYTYTDGKIAIGRNGTNEIASAASTITTGSWIHIAVVRNGSTTTIYKNGTSVASNTTAVWNTSASMPFYIGGSAYTASNIYIDDFRITKYARYTANFTAPTAAFPLQ